MIHSSHNDLITPNWTIPTVTRSDGNVRPDGESK
jgi:hypothetical protein